MEGELVGQVAALGDLDRIDLADQVRDRDVGRRELLRVAPVAGDPVDRRGVAVALHDGPRRRADRCVRIVVELAAVDGRQPRIEETDEQPCHPGLGLAALAEEDQVVPGEDRVLDRRHDRVLVADDAGEHLRPRGQAGEEVGPQLVLDGPRAPARGAEVARGSPPEDWDVRWDPRCSPAVWARTASLSVVPRSVKRDHRTVRPDGRAGRLVVGRAGGHEGLEVIPPPVHLDLEVAGGTAHPARQLRA